MSPVEFPGFGGLRRVFGDTPAVSDRGGFVGGLARHVPGGVSWGPARQATPVLSS